MKELLPRRGSQGKRKYNSELPEKLLKLMARGYKDAQIYAEWKICKDTFYSWLNEHPDFKAAHLEGLELCEAWWENKGIEYMEAGDNKKFNYWIAFMNRKFGWSRTGNTDNTTNVNIGQINVLQNQNKDQLIEFIKGKMQALDCIDLPENQIKRLE